MADITVSCRRQSCNSTNFITTITATHHAEAAHCPLCAGRTNVRSTDWPDYLSYTYMGVTRALAIKLTTKLTNFNSNRSPTAQLSLEQLVERSGTYLLQYPPSAYTPLTIICNDCASCYRVLRGQPTTLSASAPKHCIWCGSQHITISTVTDEAAVWEVLASKYALPIPLLVKVYTIWQQHGHFTHFHDFMISPNNADQLDTMRLAYELTNSKSTVEVS